MKKDIHPKVNKQVTVTCACGNTFKTDSTLKTITVELCNMCHPFYTGKQKFIDTEGRIDKFKKKLELAKEHKASSKKKAKKGSKQKTSKSLKDLLDEAKNN